MHTHLFIQHSGLFNCTEKIKTQRKKELRSVLKDIEGPWFTAVFLREYPESDDITDCENALWEVYSVFRQWVLPSGAPWPGRGLEGATEGEARVFSPDIGGVAQDNTNLQLGAVCTLILHEA